MPGPIVQGLRAGASRPISSVDDSGVERLAVDAKFTSGFVAEINLDETNDEVAVYGGVGGSETADAATRQIINVDSAGRVRTDLSLLDGVAPSLDGGRLNVNGNLQIGDADAPGNAGAATASTPRVILASNDPAVTALQIIDDWDETDRAKVNPIVGQAGVAAGSGVVSATTQRVTLATDVGLPAGTNALGSVVAQGNDGSTNRTLLTHTDGQVRVAQNPTNPGTVVDGDAQSIATSSPGSAGNTTWRHLVRPWVFNGTDWDRLRGNTSGLFAQGSVAHDAVEAGNPIGQGVAAQSYGSAPTAVASGDRVRAIGDVAGVPFVVGGHPNVVTAEYNTTAAQTNDTIMAAIAGGNKYVVTRITVTVDEATTVGVGFRIGFGAASVPAEGASGADAVSGVLASHPGLVPGGGITVGDGSGVLGVGGDGEELRITCDVPTSGKLTVTVSYYVVAS